MAEKPEGTGGPDKTDGQVEKNEQDKPQTTARTAEGGCAEPLEFATLVDYWFGDLLAADAERVEEHLFACARCESELRALAAFGEGVRRIAHQGAVAVVVTPSFLEAASRAGLRIREYVVPAGGRVNCTVTAQDDLLVSRMRADLTGVSRVDVVAQIEGQPESRLEDVPISTAAGELIMVQAMPWVRAMGHTVFHVRLATGERVLGEYTFTHRPGGAAAVK